VSYDFDFFVIGGGSGGVRAARIAGALDARVALAEEKRLGGTCVNVGCVPKKLMVFAAQYADHHADAPGFGWEAVTPAHDFASFMARKDREIERLNGIYGRLLDNTGVTLIRGRARLVDAHTVAVGDQQYTCEYILIATGGRPFRPTFPGSDLVNISDDMFELTEAPRHAVILGAGYIGVEFAGIFSGLSRHVTVVNRSVGVLRGFDEDVRRHLLEEMKKRGIRFIEPATPTHYDGTTLSLSNGEKIRTDMVLCACGRLPNTRGLGLEQVGIKTKERRGGIVVDDQWRTSVPNIYAVGDVIDHLHQLTPVALAEGMSVAQTLFGKGGSHLDYTNIPTAVFSSPEVATVGISEELARERGHDVTIYRSAFRPMKNTISGREQRTLVKVIVDSSSDKVLGFHMVGDGAADVIQGLAVAMTCGVTKAQLDATIGIHPTSAEEFVTLRTPVA
jgi:glutathione reductase (NADPH)